MTLPSFRREQLVVSLQERDQRGDSITELLDWLATTEATVGDAIGLLEEALGRSRDEAERALAEHPGWSKLVGLMGGMHGELLEDQSGFEL